VDIKQLGDSSSDDSIVLLESRVSYCSPLIENFNSCVLVQDKLAISYFDVALNS